MLKHEPEKEVDGNCESSSARWACGADADGVYHQPSPCSAGLCISAARCLLCKAGDELTATYKGDVRRGLHVGCLRCCGWCWSDDSTRQENPLVGQRPGNVVCRWLRLQRICRAHDARRLAILGGDLIGGLRNLLGA